MPYREPPALSVHTPAYVWELENVGVIFKLRRRERLCVCARALIGGAFMRAVSTFHVGTWSADKCGKFLMARAQSVPSRPRHNAIW